jgi:hypothetical protein
MEMCFSERALRDADESPKKTCAVKIRLPEETKRWAVVAANAEELNESAIIRRAIRFYRKMGCPTVF